MEERLIGRRLRLLRMERHMGREDLAERLRIPGKEMAEYEDGTREIPLDTVRRICRVLDIRLDELTGNMPKKENGDELSLDEAELVRRMRKLGEQEKEEAERLAREWLR